MSEATRLPNGPRADTLLDVRRQLPNIMPKLHDRLGCRLPAAIVDGMLVQRSLGQHSINDRCRQPTPKTIVQFWHDIGQLPPDVEECVRSWTVWETSGFRHKLFDERTAGAFIS